jgi:8-oxo-dGTP pyrophosphatase MutT (NUDIX family)
LWRKVRAFPQRSHSFNPPVLKPVVDVLSVPEGDDKLRLVCSSCGFINYRNPKIVVGSVVEDDQGRILLGRRGIEPKYGAWNLPAGFMESNETLEEGMNADVAVKSSWIGVKWKVPENRGQWLLPP